MRRHSLSRSSPPSGISPVCRRILAGVLICTLGSASVRPARAWCPPPCVVSVCPAVGAAAWAAYTTAVIEALEWIFEYKGIILNINKVIDALTRYGNQVTNNTQNLLNTQGIMDDRRNSQYSAGVTARTRADFYRQLAPARGACVSGSYARDAINGTYGSSGSNHAVGVAETAANRVFGNGETGKSDKGKLQYAYSRFDERIQRYNNPASTAKAGTGTHGADADLLPYQSVFRFDTLADGKEYETAKDVIYNLAGDTVLDPIRGPALTRVDGQNLFMIRSSKQARLNLMASVLMGTVERRRVNGAGRSTQAAERGTSYTTTHSSTYTELAINALAKTTSTQFKGQNLDTAVAMMGEAARQLFVVYTMMEQWAAVKAVTLAINVKASSAGNPTLSNRVLKP